MTAANTALDTAGDATDREIATVRTFDAPRELVWRAWTAPEHLTRWWGPNGFSTTTKVFEFNPGGQWLFTMHGPDGTDYRNEITFTVVIEPERIEYDHAPTPFFHTTVTLEVEDANKTRLSMTAVFTTVEERNRAVETFGAIEGMKQTMGRLGDYLARTAEQNGSEFKL
jgi:uncharacterized protein YndB with AHSA1/START domain